MICKHCLPPPHFVNHVPGHHFVGWGMGWQPCIHCKGTQELPDPVCTTCNDTHTMTLGDRSVMCTRCPVPCSRCRAGGTGAFCAATPCACSCHRPSSPNDAAFDLESAARDHAEVANSISPYALTDKRITDRHRADLERVNQELWRAALLYAVAELETRYASDRIPRGHAGDEPSVFDAIDYLRTKGTP